MPSDSHGKSPFLIGKPSINGLFSMAMLNNQMAHYNVTSISNGISLERDLQRDLFSHPPGCVQTIFGDTLAAEAAVLPKCFRSPIDGRRQPVGTRKIRRWPLSPGKIGCSEKLKKGYPMVNKHRPWKSPICNGN